MLKITLRCFAVVGEKVKLITGNSVKVMNLVCDEMREKGTRTTEREKFFS